MKNALFTLGGIIKNNSYKKENGIFYTPDFIAKFMASYLIKHVDDFENISILDPSCGSGNLLFAMVNLIHQKSGIPKKQIFEKNIYGVDLDPRGLRELKEKAQSLFGKDVSLKNIKQGESLFSFNYISNFEKVFVEGGFDLIISNPPYVLISRIKDLVLKKLLIERFKTKHKTSDIYGLFIEKNYELLRDGGYCSVLTVNSILFLETYLKIRDFLVQRTRIDEVIDFGLGKFKEAMVGTSTINFKKEKVSNNVIDLFHFSDKPIFKRHMSYDEYRERGNRIFCFNEEVTFNIPISRLGAVSNSSVGLTTGDIRTFTSKKPFLTDNYKCLRGRGIKSYQYTWDKSYLFYNKKELDKVKRSNYKRLSFFKKTEILIQGIGLEIKACLMPEGYLFVNTCMSIMSINGYDKLFVLACLNSKLIKQWFGGSHKVATTISLGIIRDVPLPSLEYIQLNKKDHYQQVINLSKELSTINNTKHASYNKIKNDIDLLIENIYDYSCK